MSASAFPDEELKKRLELTIFMGFEESKDQAESVQEKLLYFCIVNEEKVKSKKKDEDSEDEEDLKNVQRKDQRCVCLSISKKMKIRIHSLKQVRNAVFN